MKRSYDIAFHLYDYDSIVLYYIQKSSIKDELKDYYYSRDTISLEESTLNYDYESDTIYCPILIENIPVDNSVTLTCCFNAINKDYIKTNYPGLCPICRREMTIMYVIIYDAYNMTIGNMTICNRYYIKIGVKLEWSMYMLTQKINEKLKVYHMISKMDIMINRNKPLKRLYDFVSKEITLYDYNIRNSTVIQIR